MIQLAGLRLLTENQLSIIVTGVPGAVLVPHVDCPSPSTSETRICLENSGFPYWRPDLFSILMAHFN